MIPYVFRTERKVLGFQSMRTDTRINFLSPRVDNFLREFCNYSRRQNYMLPSH